MRILPDGTVEIKNKRTGDTKIIKPEELGSYGLSYTDYIDQAKAYQQIPGATEKPLVQEDTTKPDVATMAKLKGALTSGLTSAKGIQETLNNDKGAEGYSSGLLDLIGAKTSGPFGLDLTPWGRGLQYNLENMADVILRGRTGAQANAAEIKRYVSEFGPKVTDPPAVRQQKVENMKNEMETTAKALGMDTTTFEQSDTGGEPQQQSGGLEKTLNSPVAQFFAKWGENGETNTRNILEGLRTLPTAFQKAGEKGPLGSLELLGNAGLGILKEAGDFAPVKVENGNAVFAPEKPFQKIYNEPVSSVMDIAPFTKLPKGTWTKSPAEVVTPAETISSLGKNAPEQTSNTFTKAGARVYAKQFNVPSKIARRIDPVGTSEDILSYGFKPTDVAGAKEISERVTGANGELSKITRAAVGNTRDTIDIGNAASDVAAMAERMPIDTAADLQTITKILGGGDQNIPMRLSPIEGFDKIKELESLGYKFKNSSTPLSPNPVNEMRGQLYLDLADNLKDQINGLKGNQAAIEALKTPTNIAKLKAISPKLASDFMKAKTWTDLRAIQAPFVRLGQMADLTLSSTVSPMSSLSRGVIQAGMTAGGGAAGGLPGAAAGYALAPALDAVLEPIVGRMQTGVAKTLYGAGVNPIIQKILGGR